MNAASRAFGWWEQAHGMRCDCQLLGSLVGIDACVGNFSFCRHVLQKRWSVRCDHGCRVPDRRAIPKLPPRDPHDVLQAILVANSIA